MKILNQHICGKLLQRAMSISERLTPSVDLHYCGFLRHGTEIHVRVFLSGWRPDAGWFETNIKSQEDAFNVLDDLDKLEVNGADSKWRSAAKWRGIK